MMLGARDAALGPTGDPDDPQFQRCQYGTCRHPTPTIDNEFAELGLNLFARCADQFEKTGIPIGMGASWPIRDYIPNDRIEREALTCGLVLDDSLLDFVKFCAAVVREDDLDAIPKG